MSTNKDNKLAVFQGKQIRKVFHEGEWWFVITDIIAALTDAAAPSEKEEAEVRGVMSVAAIAQHCP